MKRMRGYEQDMERCIWDYIDGSCAPERRSEVESRIASDPLWKSHYSELRALHSGIGSMELHSPSPGFASLVAEKLDAQAARPSRPRYDAWVIRGIAAVFAICLSAGVIVAFQQGPPHHARHQLISFSLPPLAGGYESRLLMLCAGMVLALALIDALLTSVLRRPGSA